MKQLLLSLCLLFSFQAISAQCGDRFDLEIFGDEEIEVTQNVQYGENVTIAGSNMSLEFDFYEPANDTMQARPLIIWAHGGTFIAGDENSADIVDMCNAFTKRGYVNASINYRLLDLDFTALVGQALSGEITDTFYEEVVRAVADMRAAVRFFRQDAATDNVYRVDPDQIFVGGASAGAITAVHVAYLHEEADFDGFTTIDDPMANIEANGGFEGDSGNPGYPSTVSGVVNLCGAIGSAESFIQEGEVPIVSLHGDADGTVPYATGSAMAFGFPIIEMDGSLIIKNRADEVGIYNDLFTIAGGNHMAHASASNLANSISFVSDFLYPLIDCTAVDVGINDPIASVTAEVRLFPNPNAGSFAVELYNTKATQSEIRIIDPMGKVVQQLRSAANYIAFDRTDLAAGLYHLEIVNGDDRFIKRFSIQ